jgi:Yip1-like protein
MIAAMTFGQRITGVLKLQPSTFEEIEADRSATGQAVAVVVVASVAAGIGAGLLLGPMALLRETLAALIGWVMWAGVTYLIGARIMPEPGTHTDMGELLRVIGFSYAPNVFAIFAFVPVLGSVVRVVVAFWLLAATILAVRQALDYKSTARAVLVVLIGWCIFIVVQAVL